MVIVHVIGNVSSHSSWTDLHWKFGSMQENEFRGNPEFLRHHSQVNTGTSWRDSEYEHNWQYLSLMDEIDIVSWSKAKVRVYSDSVLSLEKLWDLPLSASHAEDPECKNGTLNPKNLEIELSSWQCSTTSNGQEKETERFVFQIQKKARRTRRDSRRDIRRSSALETRRSGMQIATTNLRENEIPSLHRGCNDSGKQGTQSSQGPVPWVVESWESWKEKKRYTSILMLRTELWFRIIHSVNQLRSSLKLVWRVRSKAAGEKGKLRTKFAEWTLRYVLQGQKEHLEKDCENVFRTLNHVQPVNSRKFAKSHRSGTG